MAIDGVTLATILGMATVTYATRAGGLWLMSRVPLSPPVARWLEHLPGAILVTLVAPTVLASGLPETLAALATALVARLTGNVLAAVVIGVAVVGLVRSVT